MHPHYLTELLGVDAFDPQDIRVEDVLESLERLVARRWVVSPLVSRRVFVEFPAPPINKVPTVFRQVHSTFTLSAPGRASDLRLVHELCSVLWARLQLAWPEGSYVVWRTKPQVHEYDAAEAYRQVLDCTRPLDVGAPPLVDVPPEWRVTVRLRLCSSAGEPAPASHPTSEGAVGPTLENCK
jgi:hypothetical protein